MQFITLDNIKRFFENITSKALAFSGKVDFDNEACFNGHTEFNDSIDFNMKTLEVNSDVNFNHPVVNNETVTVHGEQTNNSKVIMNGGIQVNSIVNKVSTTLLDMGEGQSITYKGEELATTDQINDLQDNLNDKLSISDGGTIDADVTFNSDTNFNAADGGVNVNTSALDISKNTYTTFNGDVEFNKGIDFNGEVDFNENANVGGTLTANSEAIFNDGITVKQSTDDGKTFTTLLNTGSGVINYKGNEIATKKDVKTQDLSGYLTKTDASNLYLKIADISIFTNDEIDTAFTEAQATLEDVTAKQF